MTRRRLGALGWLVAATLPAAAAAPAAAVPPAAACLRGVNLSGAEFGEVPGRPAFDYAYPEPAAFDRLAALGLTAVRLPFRWERIQPTVGAPLDAAELARLDAAVAAAARAELAPVLDLHNFGHHGGARLGTPALPAAALADVWGRLAAHYRGEARAVFSLMNEPYDLPGPAWASAATAAIAAVRRAGARNLVLVSGTAYSGAHSWTADLPTGNNSRDMLAVRDPLGRFAFDVHQYLDPDGSGRTGDCSGAARALAGIAAVDGWLRRENRRAFLGEVAASADPACVGTLTAILARVDADPARWVGWTAWGAGGRWPAAYPFNLEPTAEGQRPQMRALAALARGPGGRPARCDLSGHP